jgi:hypothetical protein
MSETPEVVEANEVVRYTGTEPAEAMLWRHFRKVGVSLAQSGFVPAPFRNKPDEIMAALAYGHELGLGPMQSLQSFDVIQGKPTLKPETMRALIRRAGHTLLRTEATSDHVTFYGKRRDTGEEETVTFTLEDARLMGLLGKDNWTKQPRAMLTARCTAEIGRSLFSDVLMGASYTPEEMGDDYTDSETEFVPSDGAPPPAAELGDGDSETAVEGAEHTADPDKPSPESLQQTAGRYIDEMPDEYRDEWRAWVRQTGISFNWQNWSDEVAQRVIDWVITEDVKDVPREALL